MKIYQRLEQLLKFRIYSNSEIPEYLKKLSLIGKLDEVRKQSLIILILTKLGEIEDNEETKPMIASPITVPENLLKCPNCDMVAKSKFGLSTHIRFKHKK